MKFRARLPLFVALCFAMICSSAEAKKHHHGRPKESSSSTPSPEPAAWPIETAPKLDPAAPPSGSLSAMVDRHLVGVLAPLGDAAFDQPEFLASYRAAYADGLATAPANHRAAYQFAIAVCDSMSSAVTERQNAVGALRGALATHSSEVDQPRGGRKAGQQEAREDNNFFQGTLKNNWVQRAGVIRSNITALCLRERDVERQATPWFPPAPALVSAAPMPAPIVAAAPAPAVAAATPTPMPVVAASASAPTATPSVSAPAPWEDPISGVWTWQAANKITVQGNGGAYGDRLGTWHYLCTTNSGRNYQFYWGGRKDWQEYLVLSTDGKTLDGKDAWGEHIIASRQ